MRFPPEVIQKLRYYVYLYLDPDTDEVFYVGKGRGNRVFNHLKDTSESEKTDRIKEIRRRGKEPKIEILIHGLETDQTAKRVEAAVIDLLGTMNLTNQVRGWRAGIHGRMSTEEVIALYDQEETEIIEPAVLIRINQLYRYGMSPVELYDTTRGMWVMGPKREQVRYAFAVYEGVVKEVYEVKAWFSAGSTFMTRDPSHALDKHRWEFVGTIAEPTIRDKYINKTVRAYFSKNSQNPIRYVNI